MTTKLSRRSVLMGMLAMSSGAACTTLTTRDAFALSCNEGGIFDPATGRVCPNAHNYSGSETVAVGDPYIVPGYRQPDAGRSDPSSLMVRPRGVAQPTNVAFAGPQAAGSIILDHTSQYLYLVQGQGVARRYPICVGRNGSTMSGDTREVFMMRINPVWDAGDNSNNAMANPGPQNPLGVRGIFLRTAATDEYQGYLIHGTNDPRKFTYADGERRVSNGCIRMLNPDVVDLYARVSMGARVYPVHDRATMRQYLGQAQTSLRP